ncbi:hypothetical protein KIPB_014819, partial [Kipferlia bialata]
ERLYRAFLERQGRGTEPDPAGWYDLSTGQRLNQPVTGATPKGRSSGYGTETGRDGEAFDTLFRQAEERQRKRQEQATEELSQISFSPRINENSRRMAKATSRRKRESREREGSVWGEDDFEPSERSLYVEPSEVTVSQVCIYIYICVCVCVCVCG